MKYAFEMEYNGTSIKVSNTPVIVSFDRGKVARMWLDAIESAPNGDSIARSPNAPHNALLIRKKDGREFISPLGTARTGGGFVSRLYSIS